jgi:hypothetical protein
MEILVHEGCETNVIPFILFLLEWQITHDITNIAMSGLFKLMGKELGHKKLPKNHYEAKSKLKMLDFKA